MFQRLMLGVYVLLAVGILGVIGFLIYYIMNM